MKQLLILLLFSLLAIFACNKKSTNTVDNNTYNYNDSLLKISIEEGLDYFYEGKYDSSKIRFNVAEKLIKYSKDTLLHIRLLINKSEFLKREGEYNKCLENYFEAAKLSELISDTSRLALSYSNLATTSYLLNNIDFAEKYILKAQELYEKRKEKNNITNGYIILSLISKRNNNINKAKEYLLKAINNYKELNNQEDLAMSLNNYANILLQEKENNPALKYFKKAVNIRRNLNNKYKLAIGLGNIGNVYLETKEYAYAKMYIDSSLTIAKNLNAKETILSNYNNLSTYYENIGLLDSSISYKDKYIKLYTELLELEDSERISKVEEKYKREQELSLAQNKIELLKKDKLLNQKEHQRVSTILYSVLLISIIIVLVSIIVFRKQKRIRQIDVKLLEKEKDFLETQNKLSLSELRTIEVEKEKLESTLEFKRNELLHFSHNLKERENLINSFKLILKNNPSKDEIIKEFKTKLLSLNTNDDADIYNRIEQINESFLIDLKTKFPNLSDENIRLASLIFLGLTSKEIAKILNIEPKSVDMKRYRLKKTIKIDSNIDIKAFLSKL
jgi:tetratricopeptide (TPR) repeat protein